MLTLFDDGQYRATGPVLGSSTFDELPHYAKPLFEATQKHMLAYQKGQSETSDMTAI